jgi:hypothetical protein
MLRTPFSQLFHPDLRHGAIHVKNITDSVVERAKSVIENERKSVTVTRIDFHFHVKIHVNAPGQSRDDIRNGIMIQKLGSLVGNGLIGLK